MRIFDRFIAGESRQLNEKTRAEMPGLFVKLSAGITHYDLQGPQNGDPIILIHGFSAPYFIWDPTIKALSSEGFLVIRYDLFGRGYSDRPIGLYDYRLFREQLNDLIEHLEITERLNICSLSMGVSLQQILPGIIPKKYLDYLLLILRVLILMRPGFLGP